MLQCTCGALCGFSIQAAIGFESKFWVDFGLCEVFTTYTYPCLAPGCVDILNLLFTLSSFECLDIVVNEILGLTRQPVGFS